MIGGGLAGCEAAWQAANGGAEVILYEMRPAKRTPAHKTDAFGELVCSNSLKTEQENSAPWLLKQECRRLHSLLMRAAAVARVPGGHALTVDREVFSQEISKAIESASSYKDSPRGSHRNFKRGNNNRCDRSTD